MLLNGPKTGHLSSTFGNKKFFDYFRLRTIEECLNLVQDNNRKHLCARHIGFLQRATDSFSSQQYQQAIKVNFGKISNHYCMPWILKSPLVRQFHCPVGKVHDLPFFFELFDFHDNINLIAKQFLEENNLSERSFTALHFRLGDFKTRSDFQQYRKYFTVPFHQALKYTQGKMNENGITGKLFVMAEFENEIFPNSFKISSKWISEKLMQFNNFYSYQSTEYIKLMVEMIVASKGQLIIGNHFSTLSDMIMSLAVIQYQEVKYDFYQ